MCGDTVALQFLRVPHEMSDSESDQHLRGVVSRLTLFSPSMTMTGTEVAGQRCLAGRGLSQFHRTMI